MDEINALITAIKGLPDIALVAVIGFVFYKVSILISLYGTIRFVAQKIHDVMVTKKTLPTETREVRLVDSLSGITIANDATNNLVLAQLRRVAGKGLGDFDSPYIHEASAAWLREAIDAKILAEQEYTLAGKPAPRPKKATL